MSNAKMFLMLLAILSICRCFFSQCIVTNPNQNSNSHVSLFDEIIFCGVEHHVEIPTKHTCVNLQTSNHSEWAVSAHTHYTCVTAWYNNDCTGPSIQLNVDNSHSHYDLSTVSVTFNSSDNWKRNIGSLSRCDYQKMCQVTNPKTDSKSHISLFDKLHHCGVAHHVDIPTNRTCVNLITSNRSDWALSLSTHDTCVTAWYNYDCTGPSIQFKPGDGNLDEDLSVIAVTGESGKTWKKNIGSLSGCEYEKKCKVNNPKPDSQSYISLFDKLNPCHVSNHVDIAAKHTCVSLKTSSKSKWALSISLHTKCVTSWYNNDCTGPSVQLSLGHGKLRSGLSRTAVADSRSNKTWKENIGSLSRCDYVKKCEVTNPKPDSQSHISLFDELNQCGATYHVDLPTKHTCVNLDNSKRSDWALSISTHGTCVKAWYNNQCMEQLSVQLSLDNGNLHSDLSSIAIAGYIGQNWKNNIGSLSRCDYEKIQDNKEETTTMQDNEKE